ncbi:MAG: hypothetical protein R3307_02420, partial [Anaerolineales bacterium]|nr:hypothetical protein [Anaerolineales bacterium]
MVKSEIGTNLPRDVSSRITGLLSLVDEIARRVSTDTILTELLKDFREMAREYVLLFEESLQKDSSLDAREKWLKRHEMLDKLTREWHLIYSLASAVELGSSHREQFQPYVNQAAEDIGLDDLKDNFLLIPLFGESFSLVRLSYSSSNIAILNLPVSVIHSPWELSVFWHEMAGLKVVEIRDHIKKFLEDHPQDNDI